MYAFEKIVGNERIVHSLQNAVRYGRVAHAYIFAGPPGIGKKLMAKSFAKTLLCGCGTSPCNSCAACAAFESSNHPDVLYVSPKGKKSIGVDDIREQVVSKMDTMPNQSRYKVFVIEQADAMTAAAQNALLKTIEEPKSYGVFLLLAENPGKFLLTVISRCIMYKLRPLPEPLVVEYMQSAAGLSAQSAALYGMYAQGNIGRAVSLVSDQEFINMRRHVFEILDRIPDSGLVELFSLAKELEAYKDRIQEVMDIMYFWYHDILLCKELPPERWKRFVTQQDRLDALRVGARRFTVSALFRRLETVWNAKQQIRSYANFQLTMEVMLLSLAGND